MNTRSMKLYGQLLQTRRFRTALLLAFFVVITIISAYAHIKASFSLPIPWDDESAFLFQAISFADTNSLFSPNLNSERTIMWMPPGYMLTTGCLIKVFGFSFAAVRWLSWLCGLLGLFGLVYLFRTRWLNLLFGLFFLGTPVVVSCNVARMETMLLAVVVLGFICLQRNLIIMGITVLLTSMLIHPNGCIFFGGGLLWGLYALTTRHPRIQRYEWYVMACGVAMLVAYVHFVVLNWAGFVQDMTWQFQFKGMATQQSWQSLLLGSKMQLFAIYSVLLALTLFLRKRTHLTFIGYLFLATWILRGQMWYELFLSLSVCIGIIETINLAKVVLIRFSLPRTPRICLCGAFCLVLMLWAYREGYLPGPKGYPDDLTWGWGMSVSKPEAPYITKKDIQLIGNEIDRLNKNHALPHVQFYPAAESLFFLTDKESFTPIQPIFSSMRPDITVFHHSPDIPHWLKIEKEEKRWLHRPQRIIQSTCNSNNIWVIYH